MSVFLILAAVLAITAAAALAWPLWTAAEGQGASPRWIALATSIAIGIGSFSLYFTLSDWEWTPAEHAAAGDGLDFDEVLVRLEQRLAEQPGDLEGWKMLGRTRAVLGEFELAQRAYARALELTGGEDPEAMVGFAEALAMTDESAIDGEAGRLFERAASLRPDNARALWYGGIVAYRRGELEMARTRWSRLLQQNPPEQLQALLRERLAEIDTRLGPAQAAQASPAAASGGIALQLAVAPALAGQVPAGATLFVIARRGDAGPPLAVIRRGAAELPLSLTLTDGDAMLPGMSLSGGGPLTLLARVSKSGQPTPQSGDLYGEVGYDFASTGPVSLTIDQIVP